MEQDRSVLDMLNDRIQEINKELEGIEHVPEAQARVDELVGRLDKYTAMRDRELGKLVDAQKAEIDLLAAKQQELTNAQNLKVAKIQAWMNGLSGLAGLGMSVANLRQNSVMCNRVLELESTGTVSTTAGRAFTGGLFRKK